MKTKIYKKWALDISLVTSYLFLSGMLFSIFADVHANNIEKSLVIYFMIISFFVAFGISIALYKFLIIIEEARVKHDTNRKLNRKLISNLRLTDGNGGIGKNKK